jgi:hypothetical protein
VCASSRQHHQKKTGQLKNCKFKINFTSFWKKSSKTTLRSL